mmetsp:Transcript_47687/g.107048  ORF Transcript_47687/g.107048 Transcript_47687/m.107048 type:complete len:1123 (+) Transcript_47687:100-3468(+)
MEDASSLLSKIEVDEYTISEVKNGFDTIEKRLGGAKEAGDEFFGKLKVAVPKTAGMLKRSSTVWHLWMDLIASLADKAVVQKRLEYIALRHMSAEVTPADVDIFKNVIMDICIAKLGGLMTPEFQFGVAQICTAVGLSLANTFAHYADRLKLLTSCWALITVNEDDEQDAENHESHEEAQEDGQEHKDHKKGEHQPDSLRNQSPTAHADAAGADDVEAGMEKAEKERHDKWAVNSKMNIPKTFTDMARFNASVMGVGDRVWFADVLYSMESLVPHVGNIDRMQEECDVLALTLARYDKVNLPDFKSVMFASLRSLLPSRWNMEHENAWTWFWGVVEKKVEANKQFPSQYHRCLRTFLSRLDEETLADFKLEVFETFFANSEQSQLFLRAANKRLMYIMGRILTIMADVYTKTHDAVIAISALGLLHAGHGVPEDLVRPFVASCMDVIKRHCPDQSLHQGIWWTLDLIGRIFIRTLAEGSTPVMLAINKNSAKELQKAVASSPRGERELLLLKVQVGTESISPLMWSIEKGALSSAEAILGDLLTMRADRARYYYGMEAIWTRHPDIITLLCTRAPSLLTSVLDGLVWRSKNVKNGMRRVNYYIGSMMVGEDGQLTNSLLDLIKHGDPAVVCHPSAVFEADLLWARLCCFAWVVTKLWFCVTLLSFVIGLQGGVVSEEDNGPGRFTVIGSRAFMYVCSFGQLLVKHATQTWRAIRNKQTERFIWRCHVPTYLMHSRQELVEVTLLVLLFTMLCMEPALHCLQVSDQWLTNCCEYGEWYCTLYDSYNRLACFPMLLYFLLASELVHLNVQLSVFSVVCASLWWEFILYVGVLGFLTTTFASAVACLPQSGLADSIQRVGFYNWPAAFQSMFSMALNVYGGENYENIATAEEPLLKWFIMAFAACWHVYLMNLMVAQLCQRYNAIYHNARGNARLLRGVLIYETAMPLISKKRWSAFVRSLHLEDACELDEGDNGPRGAVPTSESPYEYQNSPQIELDRVYRFGGLANSSLPWPELTVAIDDSAVGRLERMTRTKFEEMNLVMIDMAVKLGVRAATSTGSIGLSGQRSHASHLKDDSREGSKVMETEPTDAMKEIEVDPAELELSADSQVEEMPEETREPEPAAQ